MANKLQGGFEYFGDNSKMHKPTWESELSSRLLLPKIPKLYSAVPRAGHNAAQSRDEIYSLHRCIVLQEEKPKIGQEEARLKRSCRAESNAGARSNLLNSTHCCHRLDRIGAEIPHLHSFICAGSKQGCSILPGNNEKKGKVRRGTLGPSKLKQRIKTY